MRPGYHPGVSAKNRLYFGDNLDIPLEYPYIPAKQLDTETVQAGLF